MQNSLTLTVLIIFLSSCNIPEDGKNVATSKYDAITALSEIDDSAKTEVKAGPNTKPIGKPLLIAKGSEAGWYAEFFAGHLRLLINNGTDSLHLNYDFSNIVSDKPYKKTIIEATADNGNSSALSLVIQIDPKPCMEINGTKLEKTISLRYNNQNLKGCAGSKVK
jgi:hypothetical protein